LKITNPEEELFPAQPGADVRVLLPEDDQFTVLAEKLAAAQCTGAASQVPA
jgi:hypothetical protein